LHHNCHGGWSQGFNLEFGDGSDGALVEHNVIRDGSWPVQNFGGEFRYNLVVNSGHDWFRTARDRAQFHHNVIIHSTVPDGAFNGGFLFYQSEKGIEIYHNTFDGGGDVGMFNAPVVAAGGTTEVRSFRANIVQNFDALQSKGYVHGEGARFVRADYNCFFNPRGGTTSNYSSGSVINAPGEHDVVADCALGAGNEIPYAQPEGDIWNGRYGVSKVLAYYRNRFTPQAGSPVIDAADEPGADIGAVEAPSGAPRPEDRFGRFGQVDDSSATVVPQVRDAGRQLESGASDRR
jgi:hypothetical protein